jgi:hypothetical protein
MPVHYDGEEFTFFNPDGSEIKVRGWGNQFAAVFETLDGYTVVKDPASGFFQYAVLSGDGSELQPSGTRVRAERPQQLRMPQHLRVNPEAARLQARLSKAATGLLTRWEIRRQQRQRQRTRQIRPERSDTRGRSLWQE